MNFFISALCALLFAFTHAKVSYDGYKVLRIALGANEADAEKINALVTNLDLDIWTHTIAPNRNVDVQVPPEKLSAFLSGLGEIPYSTMYEDLGAAIREEGDAIASAEVGSQIDDISWFNSYHSYDDHIAYLAQLVTKFPGNSKVVTAGTSYQGRPITGIHIFGSSGGGSKPAVIMHGTVHAREWITTMTVEFVASALLNTYENSTEIKGYVDKYDYYIFPVVNPDGFVYSQTTARLWRKNRMPSTTSACIGTDINRNWNAYWGLSGGASTNPCKEDYKGSSAGSTPEYKALSSFQNAKKSTQGVKLFMDIHSYSQLWMSPYGYTCNKLPANNAELQKLAKGAVTALQSVNGTEFGYGPICSTIYTVTGSAVDYAYDVMGIKYVYTAELRDKGTYGFLLPPDQILLSGVEFTAAFIYLLAKMV